MLACLRSDGTVIRTQHCFCNGIGKFEMDKVHIEELPILKIVGEIVKPCWEMIAAVNRLLSMLTSFDVY